MLTSDGADYQPDEDFVLLLEKEYGSKIDVRQEIVAMEIWTQLNPAKRKLRENMKNFVFKWIKRGYDSASGDGKFVSPHVTSEVQKVHQIKEQQRAIKMQTSIKHRSFEETITNISWVDDPSEYEAIKNLYLNRHGFYFDGERKCK